MSPELQMNWVKLAQEDNNDALEALYNEYQLGIYAYLAGLVGKDDAYDLTQETFIKAFSKIRDLQEPAKFRPWLYHIAKNGAYDFLRRKHRYSFQSTEDLPITDLVVHSMDLAERIAMRELIQQAFASLPLKLRNCLLLHIMGGLSPAEIAPIVDLKAESVHTYICTARRMFRERYRFLEQQSSIKGKEGEINEEP